MIGWILFSAAIIVVVTCYLRIRSEGKWRVPFVSLQGKYIIVTGSNSGIGKATVTILARMNPEKIIMACRSKEKAVQAKTEIEKETGYKGIEIMILDLCSFDSIRNFAKEYQTKGYPCHILINNAGVFFVHGSALGNTSPITKEGHTIEWMSNYLGHFLLTNLLMDNLNKNSARIVNISSITHFLTKLDFNDLEGFNCIHWQRYEKSKLAQIYFTYELQRRFDQAKSGASVHCVHPGIIVTDIVSYLPYNLYKLYAFLLLDIFGLNVERGAKGPAYVATTPTLNGKGGKYFSLWHPSTSSQITYDEEIAKKLWELSEKMVGL